MKSAIIFSSAILLALAACQPRDFGANTNITAQHTSKKELYRSPAGAGTRLSLESSNSTIMLKVLGKPAINAIPLTQKDAVSWVFNGTDGCLISLTREAPARMQISQKGGCGNYGFLGSGPDKTDLDLTGPFVLLALKSGTYWNPAGAGTRLKVVSFNTSVTITVLEQPTISSISLTQQDADSWIFNGTDACSIRMNLEDSDLIQVTQQGECGNYGFLLGSGPDKTNLDLSGPYKLNGG